jgi:hypothetical protein
VAVVQQGDSAAAMAEASMELKTKLVVAQHEVCLSGWLPICLSGWRLQCAVHLFICLKCICLCLRWHREAD